MLLLESLRNAVEPPGSNGRTGGRVTACSAAASTPPQRSRWPPPLRRRRRSADPQGAAVSRQRTRFENRIPGLIADCGSFHVQAVGVREVIRARGADQACQAREAHPGGVSAVLLKRVTPPGPQALKMDGGHQSPWAPESLGTKEMACRWCGQGVACLSSALDPTDSAVTALVNNTHTHTNTHSTLHTNKHHTQTHTLHTHTHTYTYTRTQRERERERGGPGSGRRELEPAAAETQCTGVCGLPVCATVWPAIERL